MKHKTVQLSNGNRYNYQLPWDGRLKLRGTLECPIAFDTETEALSDDALNKQRIIPRVSLATVSIGSHSYFLHPTQLGDWVRMHAGEHIVGQNMRFDFWVVDNYFSVTGDTTAKAAWWRIPTEHRLHDTLLLDQLIRLGQGVGTAVYCKEDSSLSRRNLADIAKDYVGIAVDKSDPYRMRYGELLGITDFNEVQEQGFFEYAIKDAIVTHLIYRRQAKVAGDMMRAARSLSPRDIFWQAERKYGYLTEALQTSATLVLASMSRVGICTSSEKVAAYEEAVREEMKGHLAKMTARHPEVFIYRDQCTPSGSISKRKPRPGAQQQTLFPGVREPMLTKKGKTPRTRQPELKAALEGIANRLGVPPVLSQGKKGGTSLSAKAWAVYAGRDAFIRDWSAVTKKAKLLSFFDLFRESNTIHASYNPLMRTGRTSASKPNLQQAPRNKDFRGLFVARDGHLLYTVDYSYIELRTLAAICKSRYGKSALADAILAGKDPHTYTAALFMGEDYADVENGIKAEKAASKAAEQRGLPAPPSSYSEGRQAAKACFHADVEALTSEGWVKVSELEADDKVAQYWPVSGTVEFVKPLALTTREGRPLVRVHNESIDLRVTPDHRMLGYRADNSPVVCFPPGMNGVMRGIWNAGVKGGGKRLGSLTPDDVRRAVCVQADGSISASGLRVSFGFTKERKIKRFESLFPEAERKISSQGATTFSIPWQRVWSTILQQEGKTFITHRVLDLPKSYREAFLDEIQHWDSHRPAEGKRFHYSTVNGTNANCLQAVAAITGWKSSCHVTPPEGVKQAVYSVSVKKRDYSRGEKFALEEIPGEYTVYCLSVPSSFLIVRDAGKVVVTGNCNFGVPGGLGPNKLAAYAKATYGVDMSVEDAAVFRRRLTEEIYPELAVYLSDSSLLNLRHSLGVNERAVCRAFNLNPGDTDRLQRATRATAKVLRGEPFKADGTPYKQTFVDRTWEACRRLASSTSRLEPSIREALRQEVASPRLEKAFFGGPAFTLTGRIRGGCSYTQQRNGPFQGLAADGGKLALWRLLAAGFRVLAFIHDEIIVELPKDTATSLVPQVDAILNSSMEEVMGGLVPSAVEGRLAECWQK